METRLVSFEVVDSAMRVHTALGPGLLESVYQKCLAIELRNRGLKVQEEVWLSVVYEGVEIPGGYKIDLLVEDGIVVELKAVDAITDVHKAQLLSYLKLSGHEIGLLINFNVVHLRDGIKRMISSRARSAGAGK